MLDSLTDQTHCGSGWEQMEENLNFEVDFDHHLKGRTLLDHSALLLS